jgi:hypothetical protein
MANKYRTQNCGELRLENKGSEVRLVVGETVYKLV